MVDPVGCCFEVLAPSICGNPDIHERNIIVATQISMIATASLIVCGYQYIHNHRWDTQMEEANTNYTLNNYVRTSESRISSQEPGIHKLMV